MKKCKNYKYLTVCIDKDGNYNTKLIVKEYSGSDIHKIWISIPLKNIRKKLKIINKKEIYYNKKCFCCKSKMLPTLAGGYLCPKCNKDIIDDIGDMMHQP